MKKEKYGDGLKRKAIFPCPKGKSGREKP